MKLSCCFEFAASHFLTKYHGKCENLHGHNYKLTINIRGPVQEDGMVLDFKLVKDLVNTEVIDVLDHTHLNDLLENPSAENTVVWIWDKLEDKLPLDSIRLYETEKYFVEYDGSKE